MFQGAPQLFCQSPKSMLPVYWSKVATGALTNQIEQSSSRACSARCSRICPKGWTTINRSVRAIAWDLWGGVSFGKKSWPRCEPEEIRVDSQRHTCYFTTFKLADSSFSAGAFLQETLKNGVGPVGFQPSVICVLQAEEGRMEHQILGVSGWEWTDDAVCASCTPPPAIPTIYSANKNTIPQHSFQQSPQFILNKQRRANQQMVGWFLR